MVDKQATLEKERLHEAGALIYHVVGQFNATCRSVEAFLSLGSRVKRLDSPTRWYRTFESETRNLGPADTAVARERINEIVRAQFERHSSEPEVDKPTEPGIPTPDSSPSAAVAKESISPEVAFAVNRLARAFYIDLHTPRHLPMFHRALLTTVLSALEQLLGSLFQAYLIAYPASLASSKAFSIADLYEFEAIADAVAAAVEDEVDGFRRESASFWDKWFQDHLNLKFSDHAADLPRLLEAIERRNVVVHNASRVSRQYLSRLKGVPGLPALGSELPVNADYVRQVIDDIFVFGNLLCFGTWRKLKPDRDVDSHEGEFVGDLLTSGRWPAAEAYCARALALKHYDSEAQRHVLMVNKWLAIKRIRGLATIEAEVTNWDVTALGPSFVMAREALLDHADHLAGAVERAISAGDLAMPFVHTWPILEEFRSSDAYAAMLAKDVPTDPAASAPSQASARSKPPARRAKAPAGSKGVARASATKRAGPRPN